MRLSRDSVFDCMLSHDLSIAEEGMDIIGVDEVGRGPLAGPVVACAVHIPKTFLHKNPDFLCDIRDSKLFTTNPQKAKRRALAEQIQTHFKTSIEEVSVEEIKRLNILGASLLAMKMAVTNIVESFDRHENVIVFVDGNNRIHLNHLKQIPIIKGDSKSLSVAAASIVAKEYRDDLMKRLSLQFPQYGWERNSGYPTKYHRKAIFTFGETVYHRNFKVKPV